MANLLKRVHWWAAAVTVSGNLCRKDLFLSTSSRTEHSQNLKGSKICTIIHSSEKVSTPDANFAKIPRIFGLENQYGVSCRLTMSLDLINTKQQLFYPMSNVKKQLLIMTTEEMFTCSVHKSLLSGESRFCINLKPQSI